MLRPNRGRFPIYLTIGCLLTLNLDSRAWGEDVVAAMKAADAAQRSARSYRMRSTVTTETKTYTRTVEFVAPGQMHLTNETSETICVPGKTYSRRGKGKWVRSPADLSAILTQVRSPKLFEGRSGESSPRFVGSEILEGLPVMVYTAVYSSPELKSTSRMWIGASDHLLRKMEVDGETKKQKYGGLAVGGRSKTINVYYDYNAPITIVAPKG
jgi:hypothetical protein